MTRRPLPVEQVLALLDASPRRIADAVAGVAPPRLRAAPAPGEWSANDVLAHLRACADVWGGCIERILADDHPTIRAVNPGRHVATTDYGEREFAESFEAFTAQRDALLAVLRPLSPAQWARAATVTGAGRPLTRSVHGYAEWLATHERSHVAQVRRVVATVTA